MLLNNVIKYKDRHRTATPTTKSVRGNEAKIYELKNKKTRKSRKRNVKLIPKLIKFLMFFHLMRILN